MEEQQKEIVAFVDSYPDEAAPVLNNGCNANSDLGLLLVHAMELALHHWQNEEEDRVISNTRVSSNRSTEVDEVGNSTDNDERQYHFTESRLNFTLTIHDTKSDPIHASRKFLDMLATRSSYGIAGIVIGTSSLSVEKNLAVLSSIYLVPQVSFLLTPSYLPQDCWNRGESQEKKNIDIEIRKDVERPRQEDYDNDDNSLTNKDLFPSVVRLSPTLASGLVEAAVDYLSSQLGLSHCGVLYDKYDSYSRNLHRYFLSKASEFNMTLSSSRYDRYGSESSRKVSINSLRETGYRYFVAIMPWSQKQVMTAMNDAYHAGIVGPEYFWFLLVAPPEESQNSNFDSISAWNLSETEQEAQGLNALVNPPNEWALLSNCTSEPLDTNHMRTPLHGAALLHLPGQFGLHRKIVREALEDDDVWSNQGFKHKSMGAFRKEFILFMSSQGSAMSWPQPSAWPPPQSLTLAYDAVMALMLARNQVYAWRGRLVDKNDETGNTSGRRHDNLTAVASGNGANQDVRFPENRQTDDGGKATVQALLETEFLGASGLVKFNPSTGIRLYSTLPYRVSNFVALPQDCTEKNSSNHLLATKTVYGLDDVNWWVQLHPNVTFTYASGGNVGPSTLPRLEIMNYHSTIDRVCLCLSFATAALAVGFAVWTFLNRSARIVRASQPPFLIMLCVGIFFLAAEAVLECIRGFPDGFFSGPASFVAGQFRCYAAPLLMSMGFALSVGSIQAKMIRINWLLKRQRHHEISSSATAIWPFLVLLMLHCAFALTWVIKFPFQLEEVNYGDAVDRYGRETQLVELCIVQPKGYPLLIMVLVVHVVSISYTSWEAYLARGLPSECSESWHIFTTMKSVVQVIIILLPLLVTTREPLGIRVAVRSGFVLAVSWAFMLPMFLPKIVRVWQTHREELIMGRSTNKSLQSAQVVPSGMGMDTQRDRDRLEYPERYRLQVAGLSTTSSADAVIGLNASYGDASQTTI